MEGEQIDAFHVRLDVRIARQVKPDLLSKDGKEVFVDELHNRPKGPVVEDVVILVVKPDVLQNDVDHVHVFSVGLHACDQRGKEFEVEAVFVDQLADYHASDVEQFVQVDL